MSGTPSAVEEGPHPGLATSAWSETWEWRLLDRQRQVAVVVAVVLCPGERRCSYVAHVLGSGRDTVSVVEHDIARPRTGLELRASGIWADHICETPGEHWSLGLEAFGLQLDDPADALGDARGHRIPVGFDLEWEDAPGNGTGHASRAPGDEGDYRRRGRAHGELLVGAETLEVDGAGDRRHRWGTGPRLSGWRSGPAGGVRAVAHAAAEDGAGAVVEWQWGPSGAGEGDAWGLVSAGRAGPGPGGLEVRP